MSIALAFMLLITPSEAVVVDCSALNDEQEARRCEYLENLQKFEIQSVESVGVGTEEQMRTLRAQARACGLSNRIDYVAPSVSVFDIINADADQKLCIVNWIDATAPDLVFTEAKLGNLIRNSQETTENNDQSPQ